MAITQRILDAQQPPPVIAAMTRPLRKDALRNQARILAAAHAVFAEQGLDAPLEDVARRAGIGIGTLYRRYPSRQDLVEAVLTDKAQDYLAAACDAMRAADAWDGFAGYIERIFELQAGDRTVADLLTMEMPACPAMAGLRTQIDSAQQAVITRAIDAGALRADFTLGDVIVLLLAHRGVVQATSAHGPDAWRRLLRFTLDALRASTGPAHDSARDRHVAPDRPRSDLGPARQPELGEDVGDVDRCRLR
jgi:AcrR family transcriptional regulator